MPGKRPRAESRSENISWVFEKLFANSEPGTVPTLKVLKHQLLSAAAEENESIHKAAKEFTFDDAVLHFGLTHSSALRDAAKHQWNIEALPDFRTIQPSACLELFLSNYTEIYDRSSEAGCRVAVDLLLCESIAVMRGLTQSTGDGLRTPTPWDTVKVYCDVSFTHTTNSMPTTPKTIVSGRVDHSVGIVIRSRKKFPNRLFHSLLLCVEAKIHNRVSDALAQLVVYLACLRQSRINRGRSNTSVCGVATDGLSYVFVTITHKGVLKESRPFNVKYKNDLLIVLGCFRYILEMALTMSPNLTPEKEALKKSDESEAEGDDPIDLDDSRYLHCDDDDDDDDDDEK